MSAQRPTRVIDVGTTDSPCLRLLESKTLYLRQTENLIYIALSYPWGDETTHKHYRTTRANVDEHERGIAIGYLPKMFQDAIRVTRELRVSYLWIDSLCIIQGAGGDFEHEAERMETVFSAAYCVIAASRATGTSDGFLSEREVREVVTCAAGVPDPVYVCQAIDDFQHHVIESGLNNRGWVLQERALARRSIYFTAKQTYWECGEGIRCETLTRMTK